MRAFIAVLLLGHALACGRAIAETSPKPEMVDESDLLRVELAKARLELAQRDLEQVAAGVRSKYRLGPDDAIDPQTRAIRRAPKQKATEK